MESPARKADGRRIYTPEFKREQISRVLRGELSATELSRELGVARSLIQRWKHLVTQGGETAVGANEAVVPASALRAAEQRIRELERALGRKTMEVEIASSRDQLPLAAGGGFEPGSNDGEEVGMFFDEVDEEPSTALNPTRYAPPPRAAPRVGRSSAPCRARAGR